MLIVLLLIASFLNLYIIKFIWQRKSMNLFLALVLIFCFVSCIIDLNMMYNLIT